MRTAFSLVVVTVAASFLISSCSPPEPTPRNVHVGMTKEQVLRKFGQPDIHSPGTDVEKAKEQWDEWWKRDSQAARDAGMDLGEQPDYQFTIFPERFLYYSADGRLYTNVEFSEEGEVTKVERRHVKDGK
jgi:hypothetical protein